VALILFTFKALALWRKQMFENFCNTHFFDQEIGSHTSIPITEERKITGRNGFSKFLSLPHFTILLTNTFSENYHGEETISFLEIEKVTTGEAGITNWNIE
jgi:hypothetical protein